MSRAVPAAMVVSCLFLISSLAPVFSSDSVRVLDSFAGPHEKTFLDIDQNHPRVNTSYYSYSETIAELQNLHSLYPDETRLVSLGKTYEGRDIWAFKVSTNASTEDFDKPEIYINGMHHAREWLCPNVCLHIIRTLLENYTTNTTIKDIMDHRQVWFVPVVNPDGRVYDGYGDGDDPANYVNWRKNRFPNAGGSYGIDLNRNYGYDWGGSGSSGTPSDETYRGTAPFSELEIQAIRNFTRAHHFVSSISYHMYGQDIYYIGGSAAPDTPVTYQLAQNMASLITNTAGSVQNGYIPGQSSGGSGMDYGWLYHDQRVFPFLIELYPSGNDNIPSPYNGFHPPASCVPYVCNDNLEAALYLMKVSNNPYHVLDKDNDAGIVGIYPFIRNASYPMDNYTVMVKVENYGNLDQNNLQVQLEINRIVGASETTVYDNISTLPMTLSKNETYWLNWTYDFNISADYRIIARTLLTDDYSPNDERSVLITITNTYPEFSIDLKKGWNLISLPVAMRTSDIVSLLSSIDGKYDTLQYYDPLDQNDYWKVYNKDKPNYVNDLRDLNRSMGFWLHATSDCTLVINGTHPAVTDVPLFAGWNMVGYPSTRNMTVAQAFSGLPWTRVEEFNSTSPYRLKDMQATDHVCCGRGYWIFVNADCIWNVQGY